MPATPGDGTDRAALSADVDFVDFRGVAAPLSQLQQSVDQIETTISEMRERCASQVYVRTEACCAGVDVLAWTTDMHDPLHAH